MPIRLAIIDDAEVVVRGLAEMLRPFAEDVELRSLDSRQPLDLDLDLALVDVALPGRSTLLHDLVGHPRVRRVAVYSWNLDQRLVDEALRHGASAYLSKTASARDLVTSLRRVHAGECLVDGQPGTFDGVNGADRVVDGLANGSPHPDAQDGWPGRDAGLTAREAEVIALITQGLSNQEIAEHASLSINSVKSYIRTSYRKMGVTSRTNAVLWGLDHGFSPERRGTPGQDGQHTA